MERKRTCSKADIFTPLIQLGNLKCSRREIQQPRDKSLPVTHGQNGEMKEFFSSTHHKTSSYNAMKTAHISAKEVMCSISCFTIRKIKQNIGHDAEQGKDKQLVPNVSGTPPKAHVACSLAKVLPSVLSSCSRLACRHPLEKPKGESEAGSCLLKYSGLPSYLRGDYLSA